MRLIAAMSYRDPPSSLDDACSIIHDNKLYVFTPGAFMALPLEQGAEWEELKMGEKVTGAVCVGTDTDLFIVGGTGGSAEYTGLQKYSYSAKEWAPITIPVEVAKDRQFHGATYIRDGANILIYAGSQDGSQTPSDSGFIISATEPYNVQAQPPTSKTISPILLSWSDTQACMVGGGESKTAVSIWNPGEVGWTSSGITLTEPITGTMKAAIITGADGSKSLYIFDLAQPANSVRRYVIWDNAGAPVTNPIAVPNEKRDLTMDNWPEYNSAHAPTEAWPNYAIAQGADGQVVFVGGSSDEPVVVFNLGENTWLDQVVLLDKSQSVLSESTTTETSTGTSSLETSTKTSSTKTSSLDETSTSATSTASSTDDSSSTASWTVTETSAAATSDPAAVGAGGSEGNSGLSSNTILGITLGSILGFLAVLALILLLLRRKRKARNVNTEAGQTRNNYPDEKDPSAFGGQGPIGPAPSQCHGHNPQMSQESYSSMAILMGRAGKNKPSLSRNPSHGTMRSSTSSMHKQLKATISKPILQEMQHPVLQGRDTRGVAFDPMVVEPRPRNGPLETQDGLRRSSGWNRYWSGGSALQILGFGGSKRTTVGSESSHYSQSTAACNPRATQDSATVPPLNFDFRPEVNSVNSGSPVVASYGKIPFKDGVAGKIEQRPPSRASSGYSSGIPESINEAWDPDNKSKPWGANRAPNSAYNPSFYFGNPEENPQNSRATAGLSTQPQLAMASTSSDMSWLNLGDRSRV